MVQLLVSHGPEAAADLQRRLGLSGPVVTTAVDEETQKALDEVLKSHKAKRAAGGEPAGASSGGRTALAAAQPQVILLSGAGYGWNQNQQRQLKGNCHACGTPGHYACECPLAAA